MSKRLRNILYILLWAGSFFVFGKTPLLRREVYAAEKGDVVINEIMWMGSGKKMGSDKYSLDDEWIELRNMTGAEIDLSGWQITKLVSGERKDLMLTIPEGKQISSNGYFLIARYNKGDKSVLNVEPDLIGDDSKGIGKIVLVDNNLQIKLYAGDWTVVTNLIDTADDGGTGAGDKAKDHPLAGEYDKSKAIYRSMERNDIHGDGTEKENWHTCSQAVNLIAGAIECGTPRAANSVVSAETHSAPDDNSLEADLPAQAGDDLPAQAGSVADSAQSSGNSGNSDDGNIEIDLPTQAGEIEKGDVKKVKEEKKAVNGKEDKEVTKIPLNPPANTASRPLRKGEVMQGKIIINEIFPNPEGADLEKEFIELKNVGGQEVNVNGWVLKNNGNQYVIAKENFVHTIIASGGFFVLSRGITNVALNNSGDTIEIFSSEGKKMDAVSYKEYAAENISYGRIDDKWQWTAAVTVGAENIFIQFNRAPLAVIDAKGKAEVLSGDEIIFDGSDSFDPDGDKLSYFWKSSEGKEAQDLFFKETFNAPGEYKISLKVSDSYNNENTKEFKIKVLDNFLEKFLSNAEVGKQASEPIVYGMEWGDVIISEILPNPEGDETSGEWIKLFNLEDFPVSLAGWVLDDKDGGSAPYYIPEDVIIQSRASFLFGSDKTGIALNNDGDEARLLNPDGNLASAVKYEKSYEGKIFAYDEATGNWSWETRGFNADLPAQAGSDADLTRKVVTASSTKDTVGWEDLKSYEGKQINIEGYVSAKPGNLGAQVFYLTNEIKGAEVYCYKKDFPELEVGDYISVSGTASNKDGWRLTINGREDVKILFYEHPPLAKELTGDFTNLPAQTDGDLHSLVSVKGEVLEKQGNNLYVDFAGKEVKVYINENTGISFKDIKAGEQIQVIGILDYFNDEFRILPRTQEDLQPENGNVLGAQSEVNATGTTTDKSVSESDEEKNNTDNTSVQRRKKIIIFLSVSLAALAAVGWILWKRSA